MLHPNSHPRHVGNRLETTGSKFGESNLRNKDLDALHATGPANGTSQSITANASNINNQAPNSSLAGNYYSQNQSHDVSAGQPYNSQYSPTAAVGNHEDNMPIQGIGHMPPQSMINAEASAFPSMYSFPPSGIQTQSNVYDGLSLSRNGPMDRQSDIDSSQYTASGSGNNDLRSNSGPTTIAAVSMTNNYPGAYGTHPVSHGGLDIPSFTASMYETPSHMYAQPPPDFSSQSLVLPPPSHPHYQQHAPPHQAAYNPSTSVMSHHSEGSMYQSVYGTSLGQIPLRFDPRQQAPMLPRNTYPGTSQDPSTGFFTQPLHMPANSRPPAQYPNVLHLNAFDPTLMDRERNLYYAADSVELVKRAFRGHSLPPEYSLGERYEQQRAIQQQAHRQGGLQFNVRGRTKGRSLGPARDKNLASAYGGASRALKGLSNANRRNWRVGKLSPLPKGHGAAADSKNSPAKKAEWDAYFTKAKSLSGGEPVLSVPVSRTNDFVRSAVAQEDRDRTVTEFELLKQLTKSDPTKSPPKQPYGSPHITASGKLNPMLSLEVGDGPFGPSLRQRQQFRKADTTVTADQMDLHKTIEQAFGKDVTVALLGREAASDPVTAELLRARALEQQRYVHTQMAQTVGLPPVVSPTTLSPPRSSSLPLSYTAQTTNAPSNADATADNASITTSAFGESGISVPPQGLFRDLVEQRMKMYNQPSLHQPIYLPSSGKPFGAQASRNINPDVEKPPLNSKEALKTYEQDVSNLALAFAEAAQRNAYKKSQEATNHTDIYLHQQEQLYPGIHFAMEKRAEELGAGITTTAVGTSVPTTYMLEKMTQPPLSAAAMPLPTFTHKSGISSAVSVQLPPGGGSHQSDASPNRAQAPVSPNDRPSLSQASHAETRSRATSLASPERHWSEDLPSPADSKPRDEVVPERHWSENLPSPTESLGLFSPERHWSDNLPESKEATTVMSPERHWSEDLRLSTESQFVVSPERHWSDDLPSPDGNETQAPAERHWSDNLPSPPNEEETQPVPERHWSDDLPSPVASETLASPERTKSDGTPFPANPTAMASPERHWSDDLPIPTDDSMDSLHIRSASVEKSLPSTSTHVNRPKRTDHANAAANVAANVATNLADIITTVASRPVTPSLNSPPGPSAPEHPVSSTPPPPPTPGLPPPVFYTLPDDDSDVSALHLTQLYEFARHFNEAMLSTIPEAWSRFGSKPHRLWEAVGKRYPEGAQEFVSVVRDFEEKRAADREAVQEYLELRSSYLHWLSQIFLFESAYLQRLYDFVNFQKKERQENAEQGIAVSNHDFSKKAPSPLLPFPPACDDLVDELYHAAVPLIPNLPSQPDSVFERTYWENELLFRVFVSGKASILYVSSLFPTPWTIHLPLPTLPPIRCATIEVQPEDANLPTRNYWVHRKSGAFLGDSASQALIPQKRSPLVPTPTGYIPVTLSSQLHPIPSIARAYLNLMRCCAQDWKILSYLKKPSPPIVVLFGALCILAGKSTTWKGARSFVQELNGLKARYIIQGITHIALERIMGSKLKGYFTPPTYDTEIGRKYQNSPELKPFLDTQVDPWSRTTEFPIASSFDSASMGHRDKTDAFSGGIEHPMMESFGLSFSQLRLARKILSKRQNIRNEIRMFQATISYASPEDRPSDSATTDMDTDGNSDSSPFGPFSIGPACGILVALLEWECALVSELLQERAGQSVVIVPETDT